MIRRSLPATALAAVSLAAVLGACSTFTDNADVARVGDVSLGQDEFDELLLSAVPGADTDEPLDVPGDTARELVFGWVATQIVVEGVSANGGEITDADREAAASQLEAQLGESWASTPEALRDLQIEQRAAIDTWSAQLAEQPVDTEALQASYEQGIEASGIACASHILLDTAEDAADVVAELDAGADFATLAAERSTDTGSGAQGGALGCSSAAEFEQRYIPEFVDAALAAEVGVPTAPVESEFGYHVILLPPFDEVSDQVTELAASLPYQFSQLAATQDVHVDPRIGAFDPVTGVTALGSSES